MPWFNLDRHQRRYNAVREPFSIPDILPTLPLPNVVLFPRTVLPLAIGREHSLRLIEAAFGRDRLLALVLEQNGVSEGRQGYVAQRLARCATAARIQHLIRMPNGTARIVVRGVARLRLREFTSSEPYLVARVATLPEVVDDQGEEANLLSQAITVFRDLASFSPSIADELESAAWASSDPVELTYLMAANLDLDPAQSQAFLEMDPLRAKLRSLRQILESQLRWQELRYRSGASEMFPANDIVGQQIDKSGQVTQDRETGLY